jgi:hypothetical protein
MAIGSTEGITLQGGIGDADVFQRRGRIGSVPESDCFR